MAKKIDLEIQDAFRRYIDEPKQRIVAKGLIEDTKTFAIMHKYIVPNAFSELNVRLLMGEVLTYYNQRKKVPSYSVLETLMASKAKTDIEMEEFQSLINHIKSDTLLSDIYDFKEAAIKFFKQQETIKISKKLIKIVEDGYEDYKLSSILDDAHELVTPTDDDLGASPHEYLDEIFNDEDEEKITTGYLELDAMLGGGLQKGNVGLLAAHTGAGKTTFSTAMAVGAAKTGYNVLQIVFEESEKDIIKKQYACLTGENVSRMNRNNLTQDVKQKIKDWMPIISKHIIVKRLQNTKTTWEEIETFINNLIMVKNFKPDVIFIDYFDCIKHSTDMRLTPVQSATRCIKKIDNYAKTHKYAIWVMQQTNRQGAQSATKGDVEGNIQGAFAVQQTTSVNMFLTKSDEEKAERLATLTIRKNRQGSPCTFESFKFDNGTLQIDMSTATNDMVMEYTINEFTQGKQPDWKYNKSKLEALYTESQSNAVPNVSNTTNNGSINVSHDTLSTVDTKSNEIKVVSEEHNKVVDNKMSRPTGSTTYDIFVPMDDWPDEF